jgi:hypothetical protein
MNPCKLVFVFEFVHRGPSRFSDGTRFAHKLMMALALVEVND